jgi:hypothetical protein
MEAQRLTHHLTISPSVINQIEKISDNNIGCCISFHPMYIYININSSNSEVVASRAHHVFHLFRFCSPPRNNNNLTFFCGVLDDVMSSSFQ